MKPIYPWLACLLCAVPSPGWGNATDDDLAARKMAVRELMRLDTALALEQARSRLRGQDGLGQPAHAGTALAHHDSLKLMALYGVGKKLLAEVRIGGKTLVYLRGQPLAVGAKAEPSAYLLRNISGSCVHLEQKEERHTLCLSPAVGAAQ